MNKQEKIDRLYKQYKEVDKKRLNAINRYDKQLFTIALKISTLEKFDMSVK